MASDPLSVAGNTAAMTPNNRAPAQRAGQEAQPLVQLKDDDAAPDATTNEFDLARPVEDAARATEAGKNPQEAAEALGQAVRRANEMMTQARSMLKFELSKDYDGRLVVQVLDADSDELIRQIPSEQALKFAQYIDGLSGLLFSDEA